MGGVGGRGMSAMKRRDEEDARSFDVVLDGGDTKAGVCSEAKRPIKVARENFMI